MPGTHLYRRVIFVVVVRERRATLQTVRQALRESPRSQRLFSHRLPPTRRLDRRRCSPRMRGIRPITRQREQGRDIGYRERGGVIELRPGLAASDGRFAGGGGIGRGGLRILVERRNECAATADWGEDGVGEGVIGGVERERRRPDQGRPENGTEAVADVRSPGL